MQWYNDRHYNTSYDFYARQGLRRNLHSARVIMHIIIKL